MSERCSCGVDMCSADFEHATFEHHAMVTARKPHECGECGRMIQPGEQYERSKMLYDGAWDVFVTCADCLSIREHAFCGCWMYGCVLEDLREYIRNTGELEEACIVPLTDRAKDMVCAMIQEQWDEEDEGGEG